MNKIKYTIITLLMTCSALTAAEWKNPDLQDSANRQESDRTAPAAQSNRSGQQPVGAPMLTAGEAGLDTRWFCDLELSYNDKGSGGEQDVQFYQPILPAGYSMIGGYAQGNHHRASSCVLGVRPVSNESSVLIRPASLWKQVWTDENSGAFMDGSIWHPETDHPDYVCLGSVAKQGYSRPNMPYYACVHQCLVEEIPVTGYIWSDKGTGASTDVSIYRLQNSNGFYAVPSHNAPRSLRDIRRNTVCSSN